MAAIHVYLVPGIGADHRVFESISLETYGYSTTIITWEQPLPHESISAYAKRLSKQVTHENPIFIGLSFGGIIAAEFSQLFPSSKFILISSIASSNEVPWWARYAANLGMNKWFSGEYMKKPNPLIRWIFSIAPGHQRKLFDAILHDSDPVFLKWALNELLNWKGNGINRLHHIHGEKDRLLPCRFTTADVVIEDGAHFMIVSHGEKISAMLSNMLAELG